MDNLKNKYPKVLEVYYPSQQGDGEMSLRQVVNSDAEYNSFISRYSKAKIREGKLLRKDIKGSYLKRIYFMIPQWFKIVLLYILLRIIEEFLIPLIKHRYLPFLE